MQHLPLTRVVDDYAVDHIFGTEFWRENDRLTGYNRLSYALARMASLSIMLAFNMGDF